MSVRKRTWTVKGIRREAWIVDYVDTAGKRRQKTFAKKKLADAFGLQTGVEVRDGVHVADAASVIVKQAGAAWIATTELAGRERSTVEQYRQHLDLHIVPLIGTDKLTALTAPKVRKFEDDLR